MALAIFHAFELEAVWVEEEYGVVVVVIFAGGIDDDDAFLFEEGLERVDILAAAQLKRIVVEADVALAMLALLAATGGSDPEPGLAIRPADRVIIFIRDLKAEEGEKTAVKGLRLLVIADPDGEMVDADDPDHGEISFHAFRR
jgi:hypothetical protein